MTPAHLDGNMLSHYLINFGDSALSFISPPQLLSPLKIQSIGGAVTNDVPFLHNVAGPACVTGNPNCHNSAKTGCKTLCKAMRKKFRGQEIQSRAKYGEMSSGGSVLSTTTPARPSSRLFTKHHCKLEFYLLRIIEMLQ